MTLLKTLAPALRRELAPPGQFDQVFPGVVEKDLVDQLADAFGEAQLWGFFGTMELLDIDTDARTSQDLSAAGGALLVIFAGMRVIRSQLREMSASERYKAGPVEMETSRSANLLRDELAFLTKRLQQLIDDAKRPKVTAYVLDGYVGRGGDITKVGSFFRHETQGK